MDRNVDVDYATSANRWALIFCGLWPDHEVKKPSKWYSAFIFLLMNILNGATCFAQYVDLHFVWGNWDEMLENLMCSLCLTLMQVKVICFWRQTGNLGILHRELYIDWCREALTNLNKNDQNLRRRRKIMMSYARIGRMLSYTMSITMYVTCVIFLPRPYIWAVVSDAGFEERRFPYETEYLTPFVKESPFYELIYLSQCIGGVLCLTGNFATDSSITVTMLHLCGQLKLLRNDCSEIGGLEKKATLSHEEIVGVKSRLKVLVKRHLHLISLALVVEKAFNLMVLYQLVVSSTLIGVIGFQFIQSLESADIWSVGLLVFYLISQTLFVFVYCFSGQFLIDESQAIGGAIYMMNWEKLPPSVIKDLTYVMVRSEYSLTLTAGKFCVMNYATFSNILKAAGTYLSVLRAMH